MLVVTPDHTSVPFASLCTSPNAASDTESAAGSSCRVLMANAATLLPSAARGLAHTVHSGSSLLSFMSSHVQPCGTCDKSKGVPILNAVAVQRVKWLGLLQQN